MKKRCIFIELAGAGCLIAASLAVAYPPAPYHLLFGMVRDEYGTPLNPSGARVVLETTGGASVSAAVVPNVEPDANYRIEVPMDSGLRAGLYTATALQPAGAFRMKVVIGASVFLPLELKGNFLSLGKPGERTRLDLTLGADADGDGLPDAWERLIDADVSKVTADGDSDGDGLKNIEEYIAGTYAFDPKDGFRVNAIDVAGAGRVLAFLAITGRTYKLEVSSDLRVWEPLTFRVCAEGASAPLRAEYKAGDVRRVEIEVPADRTPAYYKLMVR